METRRVSATEESQANNIDKKKVTMQGFFDRKGVIYQHEVPQGTTVNVNHHIEPSRGLELTSVVNGATSSENGHCTMTTRARLGQREYTDFSPKSRSPL